MTSNLDALIEVVGLSFSHGEGALSRRVLDDVSLRIPQGEITVLTGPSGSGKSTLLTIIGGLRSACEGSVRVLDAELVGATQKSLVRLRRQIGFIFQQHNLSPALTLAQNIQMGLQHSGKHRDADASQRIQDIAQRVGLHAELKKYPDQLSGGQKQRAGIARALVGAPRLVLADEPTASLDKENGAVVMQMFEDLAADGAGIVLVTHDKRILDQADRVLSLEDGRFVPAAEVLVKTAGIALQKLMRCEPARLHKLLRYAQALSKVAAADGAVAAEEREVIRQALLTQQLMSDSEVDMVVELALAQAGTGEGAIVKSQDREELESVLNAVALADGEITESEQRVIRELLS